MNIARYLTDSSVRFGRQPAVSWRGETLSYEELEARARKFSGWLHTSGVQAGDRVILLMDNRPEYLVAVFGIWRIGAVVVPCNSRSSADEVGFVASDSRAALVVTDAAHLHIAVRAAGDATVVDVDGDGLPWSAARDELSEVADDSLAWLFYTSGTTGRPKGAMLTHGVLNFMAVAWLADMMPLDETDVTLHATPLSHAAGFHMLVATGRGCHQVIPAEASFDPGRTLELIRTLKVSNTWLVPTQIVRLTEAAGSSPEVPSLRQVLYGGAPISPGAIRRAIDCFGPIFIQLYGQGESPMTITVLGRRQHSERLLESVGFPRFGMEVVVVGDDGRRLDDGQIGEVVVRGPAVMAGYWERMESTADTLAGGWLHTGDLGFFDENHALVLRDRAKDLIISGGSNVYAAEVESVLAECESVQDVAVVGVAHELWGERVEAVIVAADATNGVDPASLDATCRSKLAGYKVPRCYHVVDALPRNAYGKVLKSDLRAQLRAMHEPGESSKP